MLCYAPDLAASTLPRQSLPSAVSNVISAGGGGLIFAQYTVNILENLYQCQGIPCVLVDFEIANKIANYMSTTRLPFSFILMFYFLVHTLSVLKLGNNCSNPVVKVSPTSNVIGMEVLAPKIAAFSSRGPSVAFPGVLKVCTYFYIRNYASRYFFRLANASIYRSSKEVTAALHTELNC